MRQHLRCCALCYAPPSFSLSLSSFSLSLTHTHAPLPSPSLHPTGAPGFFCPLGSTTSQAFFCGGAQFYCPLGSGAPQPVVDGFYSGPPGAVATMRSTVLPCPPLRSCSGGLILSGVSWGASCASAGGGSLALPLPEGAPPGAFGPAFTVFTPGSAAGYSVAVHTPPELQAPGCSAGRNLTWDNATSRLAVPPLPAPPLRWLSCQAGLVVTLVVTRADDPSQAANCTLAVNVTQVAQPPSILDCGPRVIAERQLTGTPVGLLPAQLAAALAAAGPASPSSPPSAALQASVPNVGTAILWSLNSSTVPPAPFSIGVCDGLLRSTAPLLRRAASSYTVAITATNNGASLGIGSAASYCTATIQVAAVPQPPTLCAYAAYPCVLAFSLPDFSPAGARLGSLAPLAQEADGYPILSYALLPGSGPGAAVLAVEPLSGNLTLAAPLNAAGSGTYTLPATVNVSSPYASGLHTLVLTVLASPQPPALAPQLCAVSELVPSGTPLACPPSAPPGTPLLAGSGSAASASANLTWSLPTGGLGLFSLTPSGVPLVAAGGPALAYLSAAASVYVLAVQACDPASGLCSTARLTVSLLEVPKAPAWSAPPGGLNFSLAEGSPGGSAVVGPAAVAALPGKVGGAVLYSLLSQSPPTPGVGVGQRLFALNPTTGALTLDPATPSLVFDRNASFPPASPFTYTLLLGVQDLTYGTASAAPLTVRVTVTAIAPIALPAAGAVSGSAGAGTPVLTLPALSLYGPARPLLYSLLAVSTTALGDPTFVLNASTSGLLLVANNSYSGLGYGPPRWDPNTVASFTVLWCATDVATGRVSQPATAVIALQHVNRPPAWNTTALLRYTAAQWGAGSAGGYRAFASTLATSLGQPLSAFAVDPDLAPALALSPPEALTFSLLAGNTGGTFALQPATGALSIASTASPAFAYPGAFTLTIRVTDAGAYHADLQLPVYLDPSQAPPSLPAACALSVAEHAPEGTQLALLAATSPAPTTRFTYTLTWAGANVNMPFPFAAATLATPGAPAGLASITVAYAQTLGSLGPGQGPIAYSPWLGTGLFRSYAATLSVSESRPGVAQPLAASLACTIAVTWVPEPPFFNPATVPPAYAAGAAGYSGRGWLRERGGAGTPVTGEAAAGGSGGGGGGAASPPLAFSAFIKDPFLQPYLVYALTGDAAAWFTVNASSGALALAPAAPLITYLATPQLALTLSATVTSPPAPYGAASGLSASLNITVAVVQVNTAAAFTGLYYANGTQAALAPAAVLAISEATPPGSPIGRLVVADPNPPTTLWGLRHFSLAPTADASSFAIDPTSGLLSTAPTAALSFYSQAAFQLTVLESDLDPLGNLTVQLQLTVLLLQANTVSITSIAASPASLASGAAVSVPSSPAYAAAYPTMAVLLSSSLGGVLLVNGTGFGPRSGLPLPSLRAAYGPGFSGPCTLLLPNTLLSCALPGGFGLGYSLSITVNSQWTGASAPPMLLGYFPPLITGVAVAGAPAAGIPTSGTGASFVVTGVSLGPPGATSTLSYGPAAAAAAAAAAPLPFATTCTTGTPPTSVTCPAAPGYGANLTFLLTFAGSPSPAFTPPAPLAYAPPTLTSLSAPLLDTAGGGPIALSGANLGPPGTAFPALQLLYGGSAAACAAVAAAAAAASPAALAAAALSTLAFSAPACTVPAPGHSAAACSAAPGVGAGLCGLVLLGGQPSQLLLNSSLSYQPPAIAQLRGPGAAPSATSGGGSISIVGTQFGPLTPTDPATGLLLPANAGFLNPSAVYGRGGGAAAWPLQPSSALWGGSRQPAAS